MEVSPVRLAPAKYAAEDSIACLGHNVQKVGVYLQFQHDVDAWKPGPLTSFSITPLTFIQTGTKRYKS